MGYCKICERRWMGLSECHCSGCCKHFKSLSGFEKHRVNGECLTSEQMIDKKMVFIKGKDYWIGKAKADEFTFPSRI